MAYLTVREKGASDHRFHDIDGDRVTVGRSDECDLSAEAERLSRKHCEITREGEVWFVEDLGSSNGTRVNNERIDGRHPLAERDVIKAGNLRLTFHSGRRGKKKSVGPIDVAAGDGAVVSREYGADDPVEAAPCEHCAAWLSIAHRVAGDRMTCPVCKKPTTVPQLVS